MIRWKEVLGETFGKKKGALVLFSRDLSLTFVVLLS